MNATTEEVLVRWRSTCWRKWPGDCIWKESLSAVLSVLAQLCLTLAKYVEGCLRLGKSSSKTLSP